MLRLSAIVLSSLFICVAVVGQEQAPDPYSMKFVENNLRIASASGGGEWASAGKDFQRLGDAVSIALLKVLSQQDLRNPDVVRRFLPIIRQSFSYPSIISIEADKNPKVTLFLLADLQQNISDPGLRHEIRQTISFIKQKTST
ncbi:MAG TPA: hypothetical protein VKP61_09815 [Candidatus Acidoferrum sp.]|nr:hypothetical protein [Candidatus Acidoferrum sp.]